MLWIIAKRFYGQGKNTGSQVKIGVLTKCQYFVSKQFLYFCSSPLFRWKRSQLHLCVIMPFYTLYCSSSYTLYNTLYSTRIKYLALSSVPMSLLPISFFHSFFLPFPPSFFFFFVFTFSTHVLRVSVSVSPVRYIFIFLFFRASLAFFCVLFTSPFSIRQLKLRIHVYIYNWV